MTMLPCQCQGSRAMSVPSLSTCFFFPFSKSVISHVCHLQHVIFCWRTHQKVTATFQQSHNEFLYHFQCLYISLESGKGIYISEIQIYIYFKDVVKATKCDKHLNSPKCYPYTCFPFCLGGGEGTNQSFYSFPAAP